MSRAAAAACVAASLAWAPLAVAQEPEPAFDQTQADAYTRYELLEPRSESFRIIYDVGATTPGVRYYFNPIRKGSEPTVHGVTDLASGKPLEWRLVDAAVAANAGLRSATDPDQRYIQVLLARPVPEGGQGRIRIDKTYKDPASYAHREVVRLTRGTDSGHALDEVKFVDFERALGVRRNSVVLPLGYELIECNYPSQVEREADGRIRISFMNRGVGPVALRVVGRKLPESPAAPTPVEMPAETPPAGQIESRPPTTREQATSARVDFAPSERAFQDREIVYFMLEPESQSFRLYHDYTESRPGVDRYLNVVRPGSRASDPSAMVIDTGEKLEVETLRGAEITEKELDIGEEVTAETEVVVIWFDPVEPGGSKRLRIEETYTDPGRYGLDGDELLWDRSFGRNRNKVVLPHGWYLTRSTIPAVVDQREDGRIRLSFQNDRPDVISVLIRARRR